MAAAPKPLFFESPSDFSRWLEANHSRAVEVLVGFWKLGSGRPTLTWSDAVDEALCYGWIDGVRKRIDAQRYQIRFTPRRPGSKWSALNLRKAAALVKGGRLKPPGLRVWKARSATADYSYEQPRVSRFSPKEERMFRRNKGAWKDWTERAPSYRKAALSWIVSAKQEATRQRRFAILIQACAAGKVIPPMKWSVRARAGKK